MLAREVDRSDDASVGGMARARDSSAGDRRRLRGNEKMTAVRTRPVWAALLCALLMALSGCTMTHAQQQRSSKQVYSELNAIPGVSSAQLNGGSSGMPGRDQIGAAVALEPGYDPDIAVLLDYVLAELWSQTSVHPTTVVTVSIQRGGNILDLASVATTLGLKDRGTRPLALAASDMAKRYGTWPGPVPALPAALASPTATPSP